MADAEADRVSGDDRAFRWLNPGELIDVPVPSTAIELDCLLRHIELDADFGDWAKAAVHLAEARALWALLEVPVARKVAGSGHLQSADKAAREMSRLLACMGDCVLRGARGDMAWLARRAIDAVEWIERALF